MLGASACIGTFSIAAYFYINEGRYLGHPDTLSFMLALAGELFGVLVFATPPILPYYTASIAAKKTDRTTLFLVVSLLVLIAHTWLTIDALFFATGSTAAVGIFFFPIYLSVPILLIWWIAGSPAGKSA